MWLVLVVLIIILPVTLLYFKLRKTYKYWNERGVIYEEPTLIFGNINPNIFGMGAMKVMIERVYNKFSNHRYVGLYQFVKPTLLIRDLELIKQITLKDFDYFADHITFLPPDVDPLWGKNLFQLSVKDGWKDMRTTLSPFFTSIKMKMMFELMKACCNQFIEFFKKQGGTYTFEAKDFFSRFANDVIGSCAFGITSDSLMNPNNEFFRIGRDAADIGGLKIIKLFGYSLSPTLTKLLGIKHFNKKSSTFFRNLIKNSIRYRKEQNIVRPDMIHLMLEAQKIQESYEKDSQSKKSMELSYESITAQVLVFFTAGFETTSSAMTFLAYDLAFNVDVQHKLYEEITEVLSDGKELTCETLLRMTYLDCVVSESLRLHSINPILNRKCVKPYTIKPVLPTEKPLQLEEGTLIWIPSVAIQNDEKYFPNPSKFDPERFNTENKSNLVPYSYIPFGVGPRACLGSRFALMEMKLMVVELLRNFKIMTTGLTEVPLKPSTKNFSDIPDEGVFLTIKPRLLNE